MSIRTKILVPLVAFIVMATLISALIGFRAEAEHDAMAGLAGKAISAGDMSRKAHDDFDGLGDLVAEVAAMTHFVEPSAIEQRFTAGAAATTADLEALKAAALSPEMSDLAQKAIDRFGVWKGQAEVLLGLRQAKKVTILDVMNRDAGTLKALLAQALALAGHDADAGIAAAGTSAKAETFDLLALASGFALAGIAGAFWLARNLSLPLKSLAINAEKLAAGDTSVPFAAASRSDEIGEISRAVALFRDNVLVAQRTAAAEVAMQAQLADERVKNEAISSERNKQQADVVRSIADGLERLSDGDLVFRLNDAFPADYEKLRVDFNKALETLQSAMKVITANTTTIRSGTEEIRSSTDELSQRTERQAATIEQTAAALDQITETVKRTADGAAHARATVSTAKSVAQESGEVVRRAVSAMGGIEASAKQIGQIIGVIDEIAFQTNLLALNAGVEAARAGDAGRGFAVVASEVRGLAQRSAEAAKEIKTLILASTREVQDGVDLVGQTGQKLENIVAQVTEINAIIGEIARSTQEQATSLHEVNVSVNQMDRAVQENAAMVQESAEAAVGLAEQTEDLTRLVSRFRVGEQYARTSTSRATRRLQAV